MKKKWEWLTHSPTVREGEGDYTELGIALFLGRDQSAGQGHHGTESSLVNGWRRGELTPISQSPSSPCTWCPHPAENGTPPGEHGQGPAHTVDFCARRWTWDLTHEKMRLEETLRLPGRWLQEAKSNLPVRWVLCRVGHFILNASQCVRNWEKTVLQCSPLSTSQFLYPANCN